MRTQHLYTVIAGEPSLTINTILQPLLQDIQVLSTTGIVSDGTTIKVFLAQLIGDQPAVFKVSYWIEDSLNMRKAIRD